MYQIFLLDEKREIINTVFNGNVNYTISSGVITLYGVAEIPTLAVGNTLIKGGVSYTITNINYSGGNYYLTLNPAPANVAPTIIYIGGSHVYNLNFHLTDWANNSNTDTSLNGKVYVVYVDVNDNIQTLECSEAFHPEAICAKSINSMYAFVEDEMTAFINSSYTNTGEECGDYTTVYPTANISITNKTYETAHAELDVEDIEMETVFSISDIADITNRKDSITKNIALRGTKNNNEVLGNLFFQQRVSDETIANKLFFNYNPLRLVDCLVYEDNLLLLKGSMLITEIAVDKNGSKIYNATITGKLIEFKTLLADSKLEDLDFADLKHHYTRQNIIDSWGGYLASPTSQEFSIGQSRIEKYNPETNTYSYQPFEFGKGYVYPFIDYGVKFMNDNYNYDYQNFNIYNFKPAIYVFEYIKRIFKTTGYTFELKGNENFNEMFKSLIIPDNKEGLIKSEIQNRAVYTNTMHQNQGDKYAVDGNNSHYTILWNTKTVNGFSDYYTESGDVHSGIRITRSVKTSIKASFNMEVINSDTEENNEAIFQLYVRRGGGTEVDVFAEKTITIPQSSTSITFDLINDNVELFPDDIILLWIKKERNSLIPIEHPIHFTINSASLQMSKDEFTPYILYLNEGEEIKPNIPENIKQVDFIKSVLTMFNIYAYPSKEINKHIILETYDDYYALSSPALLPSNALDWTNKIDYSSGLKLKSNLTIPKKYKFSFKSDSDTLNKSYTDRYKQVYGELNFNDAYGITAEKKVELMFSPSPQVEFANRLYPMYVADSTSLLYKKPTNTNIRILFYNGVFSSNKYSITKDVYDNEWKINPLKMENGEYGFASEYYYSPNGRNKIAPILTPEFVLHFSYPREFYFNNPVYPLPNLYSFYINQISELSNINLFIVEVNATLNEVDISNLDLKTPVFIDLGNNGYSYYKILKIEYKNNKRVSSVTLQKIT